jgi:hypothetical protein
MPMLRYDYDSVLERLKQRTLRKLKGQNLILFSTNAAYLEAVAEEFDDLSMYDEFLTRENIWDTAKGNSSIMKQVGFFDYRPHRKIGATGLIRFSTSPTFDGNWPNNISLPVWRQASGGGITFLSKAGFYLPNTAHYVDIPVIQGEVTKFTTVIEQASYPQPTGTAYAQIPIFDPDIENTLYEVRVNGELWKEIGGIRLAVQEPDPEKAKVYALSTMSRYEGVILLFGNDMLGKSIQYGDSVEFTYLKTKGTEGNVLSAGIVTTVDSEIEDELGNHVALYCTNLSALTGGQNYEILPDIKTNAPRSFQTGNRAISSPDYETLIKATGTVDKVQVWGEKEINEDRGNPPGTYLAAAENLIYITGYTIDPKTLLGISITESNKKIIREHLNDKKGTTDILQFVDTQIIYLTFKPIVFIKDTRYTPEQIREFVHNALVAEYSVYRGVYRTGLFLSDYYSIIDAVTGVDHCTCTLKLSEMALFTSAYEFSININLNNIKKKSVSIKIKNDAASIGWQEMAHDDGNGNLIGSLVDHSNTDPEGNQFLLPGATVNYQDGSIGDIIVIFGLTEPFANYQIRIDFELEEIEGGELKPTLRNQLYAWYADEIQTRLMI